MTNPKGEDFRKVSLMVLFPCIFRLRKSPTKLTQRQTHQYRDIAPEGVDDEAILSLIKKSAGSHAAITAAIENMWHGKKQSIVIITVQTIKVRVPLITLYL